jgi:excisionase family DNA binding protein
VVKKPAAVSSQQTGPRLLTLKAASEYTGIAVWFLRKLVWESQIAHVRLGEVKSKIYFERADLDAYLAARRVAVGRIRP